MVFGLGPVHEDVLCACRQPMMEDDEGWSLSFGGWREDGGTRGGSLLSEKLPPTTSLHARSA